MAIIDEIAVLFAHLLNDVDAKDDLAFAKAVSEELLESYGWLVPVEVAQQ